MLALAAHLPGSTRGHEEAMEVVVSLMMCLCLYMCEWMRVA